MEKKDGYKLLNIRMTKELWLFLKNQSIQQEKSMNHLVLTAINQYRKTKVDKDKEQ